MALHVATGSGAPASVPVSVGEHYIDTATGDHYISNGTETSANWVKMIISTAYVRLSSDGRLQVLNETDSTWITVRGRNDPDGDRELYASAP